MACVLIEDTDQAILCTIMLSFAMMGLIHPPARPIRVVDKAVLER